MMAAARSRGAPRPRTMPGPRCPNARESFGRDSGVVRRSRHNVGSVRQREDGLSGLLVTTILGNSGRIGHELKPSCGRLPQLPGFSTRTSDRGEVRLSGVGDMLCVEWALLDSNQ
jgi:hypothetical protein